MKVNDTHKFNEENISPSLEKNYRPSFLNYKIGGHWLYHDKRIQISKFNNIQSINYLLYFLVFFINKKLVRFMITKYSKY